MTGKLLFRGVGAALATIFADDGKPDLAATADHAAALAAEGCAAILVSGTAGESWRLSARDRVELAIAVRDATPGVPLLVGTGDVHAERGVAITRELAQAGVADALLVLSPCDETMKDRIAGIAGETPVMAYHLPHLSPPGVPVQEVEHLPIDAIKDSSGDADRLGALLARGHSPVYVGSPNLLLLAGACGAAGALVALANTSFDLCRRAWSGDAAAQYALMSGHIASMRDFPANLKPGRGPRVAKP